VAELEIATLDQMSIVLGDGIGVLDAISELNDEDVDAVTGATVEDESDSLLDDAVDDTISEDAPKLTEDEADNILEDTEATVDRVDKLLDWDVDEAIEMLLDCDVNERIPGEPDVAVELAGDETAGEHAKGDGDEPSHLPKPDKQPAPQ
jgi:hypothetical protein